MQMVVGRRGALCLVAGRPQQLDYGRVSARVSERPAGALGLVKGLPGSGRVAHQDVQSLRRSRNQLLFARTGLAPTGGDVTGEKPIVSALSTIAGLGIDISIDVYHNE
jgi:hypothetical protein